LLYLKTIVHPCLFEKACQDGLVSLREYSLLGKAVKMQAWILVAVVEVLVPEFFLVVDNILKSIIL